MSRKTVENEGPGKTEARKQFEKKAFPVLCLFLNDESSLLPGHIITANSQWLSPDERQEIVSGLVADGWLTRARGFDFEKGEFEADTLTCYRLTRHEHFVDGFLDVLPYAYFVGNHFPGGITAEQLIGCCDAVCKESAEDKLRWLVQCGFGSIAPDGKTFVLAAKPVTANEDEPLPLLKDADGFYRYKPDAKHVRYDSSDRGGWFSWRSPFNLCPHWREFRDLPVLDPFCG